MIRYLNDKTSLSLLNSQFSAILSQWTRCNSALHSFMKVVSFFRLSIINQQQNFAMKWKKIYFILKWNAFIQISFTKKALKNRDFKHSAVSQIIDKKDQGSFNGLLFSA